MKRVFFSWILAALLLIVLYALFGPASPTIDYSNPSFKTKQSSLLYFKNLRAYFYDKTTLDSSGIEFLRIQSRKEYSDSLQVVVVRNWRLGEAYLLFEKKDQLAWEETLTLRWAFEDQEGIIQAKQYGPEAHFSLAAQLLYELNRNSEIFLSDAQTPMSERSKKSLKRSLKDYFKLLGYRGL